ncbi:radical SAM protein [Desulfobacterales bacterium HSG16]|nr:radical SAM protein [Desulfobacterales bacterium HSG16]
MSDVFLIQPPIRDFYLTAKRTIPYGLACVGAGLRENGFSVELFDGLAKKKSKIIDWPEEFSYLDPYYGTADISPFGLFHHFRHFGYSFDHIAIAAKKSGAFIAGISSLFTCYCKEALKTAEAVKKRNPLCKIVMGGHHPTIMYEDVMANPAVDYVIRGEGEESMPELACAIKKGKNFEDVPGIVFRNAEKGLFVNPPAMVTSSDRILAPASDLVKNSFYTRNKRGTQVVTASRGCPMSCSYCCFGKNFPPYRRRSVTSVIEEIENYVNNHDAGFIDFEDENLSMDKKWFTVLLTEICERFGEKNLELRAMNGLFPPTLDKKIIQLMKKAGFKVLNLSVGSFSKAQLARFNRPDVKKDLDRVLFDAKECGLDAVCYIIVGAPGQSTEKSVDDLLFLAERKVLAGVSVFYPAPGSADWDLCGKNGLMPETLSMTRSSAVPIAGNSTERRESLTLMRLGRISNFIKFLDDRKIRIPEPAPISDKAFTDPLDRVEAGVRLLAAFFYDSKIKGITTDGKVFEHETDGRLCKKFIRRILKSVSEQDMRGAYKS